MEEIMLRVDNVSKIYKLGQIGGTTLRDELQRKMAKIKGREDPTRKIGAKNYNQGEIFRALDGVSLEVKKGERVGIIGHNGAGKSTLLKLISRVTAPSSGKIQMNGRVASMLEVGTGFHGELTGRENIYMNGAILGMTKSEIESKIEDIIEFSEVRKFIDTPVKRYSSGMYVKLAFSVAAHLDSEIMIMDEVLAVGDVAFQKKCLDKMNDVSKNTGRTILYVSHNMNTIRELCDRVIVLDQGRVVFDGDVEDGIDVYMQYNQNTCTEFDLNKERLYTSHDKYVKLMYLSLYNKEIPTYDISEDVLFNLEIESKEEINNAGLRLEVRYADNTSIGTSLNNNIGTLHKGVNNFSIVYPKKNLIPGDYFAVLVLYEMGEYNHKKDLDAVGPAFYFSVSDIDNKFGINWEKRWGKVAFDNLIVNKKL